MLRSAAALAACTLSFLQFLPVPLSAERIFSVPTSGKVVSGRLILPRGQHADFQVLEGGMLRVTDDRSGHTVGLSPTIQEDGQVVFTAFDIREVLPGHEAAYEIGVLESHGITARLDLPRSPLQLQIHKVAVANHLSRLALPLDPWTLNEAGLRCCVTCDSTTVCGCAVVMGCGGCCAGPCCPAENQVE